MFLSRGDRDLGVAFQTHPGRQAFISSGSKEPRSALESRRVSLGGAYLADDAAGLQIIDITNSAVPVRLGECLTSGRSRDVVVSDTLAYVADAYGGLQI